MMPGPLEHICFSGGRLIIDDIDATLLAQSHGTPLYVYSGRTIRSNCREITAAFARIAPRLHYAVKACGNLNVLRLIASMGLGMDVVSGGELERAYLAGGTMEKIVFSGCGKTEMEIRAALDGRFTLIPELLAKHPDISQRGRVGLFNVESEAEGERIDAIANELGTTARACLRVNPDVDAHTHAYTTTGKRENKFGVPIGNALEIFDRLSGRSGIQLRGIHMHLGSPISSPNPYVQAITSGLSLIDTLRARGHRIELLNIGGGIGIEYGLHPVTPMRQFAGVICDELAVPASQGMNIMLEPGRCIVGNAGVLLTRVQYVKQGADRCFVVCDAGMHTLVRPALYDAYHFIWPTVTQESEAPQRLGVATDGGQSVVCDVVGPICESSDFLAKGRSLPRVKAGDVLAVFCAGAYGMSMTSTYNDHPKPPEVLIDSAAKLVRPRQTQYELIRAELAD